jgi:hypothetical protein
MYRNLLRWWSHEPAFYDTTLYSSNEWKAFEKSVFFDVDHLFVSFLVKSVAWMPAVQKSPALA